MIDQFQCCVYEKVGSHIGRVGRSWCSRLSWRSRIPLRPILGRCSLIFSKTAGRQTVVYHCTVTVLLLSRPTMAMCPLVAKQVATIFFPTLPGLLTSQWSIPRGDPHGWLVLCFGAMLFRISKFHHLLQCWLHSWSRHCGISVSSLGTSQPGQHFSTVKLCSIQWAERLLRGKWSWIIVQTLSKLIWPIKNPLYQVSPH